MTRYILCQSFIIVYFGLVPICCGFYIIKNYSGGKSEKSYESSKGNNLMDNCGNLFHRGVCIHAHACPPERIVWSREDECLRDTDDVCCQVAQVRMPTDLFAVY